MDDLQLLIDFHISAQRQGPGGDNETLRALELAGINRHKELAVADIGCGTGASTICLARTLNARITAIDLIPDFLQVLQHKADKEGLSGRIQTLAASMDELPLADGAFDLLWSEGAIYNIGFRNGIESWKGFLKPGGILVVSEITWTTALRPAEIEDYWEREYPEIATASAKIGQLESAGYTPIGYFPLPENCWLDNYYEPLRARYQDFLQRHRHCPEAVALVQAEEKEIKLYEKYKPFYSYGVYCAQRP